jgi:serine-type D-Ala-D-Ala carboxypeptidase/endopeptidase
VAQNTGEWSPFKSRQAVAVATFLATSAVGAFAPTLHWLKWLVLATALVPRSVTKWRTKRRGRRAPVHHGPLLADSEGATLDVAAVHLEGGRRRIDFGGTAKANSRFEVGSLTKGFIGIALADLVLNDRISLSDQVSKYLPGTHDSPLGCVTIGDLASHQSGLSRLGPLANDVLMGSVWGTPYGFLTERKFHQMARRARLAKPPGLYSNFGFMVLGSILQSATKTPLDELLHSTVFEPLGMASTGLLREKTVVVPKTSGGSITTNWRFRAELSGAGGYQSTIEDLELLVLALLVPSTSALEDAINLATTPRASISGQGSIGLGWLISDWNGPVIWHNGGTSGFGSFVGVRRDALVGVAVVANGGPKAADTIGKRLIGATHP